MKPSATYEAIYRAVQRALLELERVLFSPDGSLDLSRYQWQPSERRRG